MNNRKPAQQFKTMMALVNELNAVGHPSDKIWFTSDDQSPFNPVAFLSADCRMIAQRHNDGTWWVLYGYDDATDPNIPNPSDAYNLEVLGPIDIRNCLINQLER